MKGVSVLTHVRSLIRELDKRMAQQFAATEQAIKKAETATELRLHALNELRSDVATHSEVESVHAKYDDLKERVDRMEGRQQGWRSGGSILLGLLTAASIVVAIVATFSK